MKYRTWIRPEVIGKGTLMDTRQGSKTSPPNSLDTTRRLTKSASLNDVSYTFFLVYPTVIVMRLGVSRFN
jgi:hypothetical protein